MTERVKKIEDGYYAIQCHHKRFTNTAGQIVVPPPGPVFLSLNEEGVTVEDLRAIIADMEGAPQESACQMPVGSTEPKKRGRKPKSALVT